MSTVAYRCRPPLSTGSRLVVVGEGRELRSAIVVRVKDGLIWISGSANPGHPGERVEIVHVVPDDAQYWSAARVELIPPETLALRRTGPWQRLQRRSQVRLSTHGVDLDVTRIGEFLDSCDALKFPMLDVSASGASGRTRADFGVGDSVRCDFRLPGGDRFEVTARVARIVDDRSGSKLRVIGFEFTGIGIDEQASLRRWIYREEARRYRDRKLREGKKRGGG